METNQSSDFNSGTSTTATSLREGKENVANKVREKGAELKQGAREATAGLKEKGTEAVHQFQEKSRVYAQTRKSELGDRISGYGSAFRRTAEKLREEEDPNIAQYADMVAAKLESAGDYVRSSDLSSIMHDVENVARRRPELVFGGMFVAGLVIARFLKASEERDYYEEGDVDYWAEDDFDETEDVMGAPVVADPMPAAPLSAGQNLSGTQGLGSTPGMGTPQGAGGTPTGGGTQGPGSTTQDPWVRGTGGQN